MKRNRDLLGLRSLYFPVGANFFISQLTRGAGSTRLFGLLFASSQSPTLCHLDTTYGHKRNDLCQAPLKQLNWICVHYFFFPSHKSGTISFALQPPLIDFMKAAHGVVAVGFRFRWTPDKVPSCVNKVQASSMWDTQAAVRSRFD